jgi:hypothetical protein
MTSGGLTQWSELMSRLPKDADHYIDPDERFRVAMARQ